MGFFLIAAIVIGIILCHWWPILGVVLIIVCFVAYSTVYVYSAVNNPWYSGEVMPDEGEPCLVELDDGRRTVSRYFPEIQMWEIGGNVVRWKYWNNRIDDEIL